MKKTNLLPIIVLIFVFVVETESNFEDARCRCTCPSTEYFYSGNKTGSAEFKRRYYTSTEIKIPSSCNTQMVVKNLVINRVDESRLDAFLANCNCKFELRNSVLLKVVVIFVICIIFLLSSYMAYLLVIEPVILKRRRPLSFVPYERHRTDDVGAHSFHTFWFRPITNRFTRLRESRSLLPSSSSSSCSLLDEEGQSGERDVSCIY